MLQLLFNPSEMDDAASNFSSTSLEQVTEEFDTEILTTEETFLRFYIFFTTLHYPRQVITLVKYLREKRPTGIIK